MVKIENKTDEKFEDSKIDKTKLSRCKSWNRNSFEESLKKYNLTELSETYVFNYHSLKSYVMLFNVQNACKTQTICRSLKHFKEIYKQIKHQRNYLKAFKRIETYSKAFNHLKNFFIDLRTFRWKEKFTIVNPQMKK